MPARQSREYVSPFFVAYSSLRTLPSLSSRSETLTSPCSRSVYYGLGSLNPCARNSPVSLEHQILGFTESCHSAAAGEACALPAFCRVRGSCCPSIPGSASMVSPDLAIRFVSPLPVSECSSVPVGTLVALVSFQPEGVGNTCFAPSTSFILYSRRLWPCPCPQRPEVEFLLYVLVGQTFVSETLPRTRIMPRWSPRRPRPHVT